MDTGADSASRPARRRDPTVTVACLSALFATIATLAATRRGPGLGPDSTMYLSAGLNLATGHGLRSFDGGSLTLFPPGLPGVVALGHRLGLGADSTVRWFNAAMFGGAVYLGFVLVRRHVRSNVLVVASTFVLALSPPLLETSQMAMTEPAFVVACLGLILVLEQLVGGPRSVPLLLTAAALIWIGFAFRYAGLALIPAAGIALLVGQPGRRVRDRLTSAAIVVSLGALGPLTWMVRNHRVDGTLMGARDSSTDTLRSTATSFVATLKGWAVPGLTSTTLREVVGTTLVLVGAGGLAWWAVRRRHDALTTDPVPDPATDRPDPSLVPIVVFVGVYSVYLVAAQLTTAIDPIGTRLMSPLYVPLVVLSTIAIDRVARRPSTRVRRLTVGAVAALVVLLLVGQTVVFVRDARRYGRDGFRYTAWMWRSSELAEAARSVPPGADLYSNNPWGLWAILRRDGIEFAPFKGGYRTDATYAIPGWFLMSVRCRPSYFAAFATEDDIFYSADELRGHIDLVPVATVADGMLYRLEPLASDTEPCAWR